MLQRADAEGQAIKTVTDYLDRTSEIHISLVWIPDLPEAIESFRRYYTGLLP
jgi:hypothetical protein